MTKRILVKKVSEPSSVEGIQSLFDQEQIPYAAIENASWKEDFPYEPQVRFRVAHTGEAILLEYLVKEDGVRAVAGKDNGNVWEDSCVEFFIQPNPKDGIYYNFECNCAANLLEGMGPGRANRTLSSEENLKKVERWSTYQKDVLFQEKSTDGKSWSAFLRIPYSAFFAHDIKSMDQKVVRGNFYKCGDKLSKPHYLSWNPIDLPKPNFHCPEFFGELEFE